MTSVSLPGSMVASGLVGQVPVARRPGQLEPGWEVGLSIQEAQIRIRCLPAPFPPEQVVKIQGGAFDTHPLRPQGLG